LAWKDLLGGKPLQLAPGKTAPKINAREHRLGGFATVLARITIEDTAGEVRLESFHQVEVGRLLA
jgi:hypothetical protein